MKVEDEAGDSSIVPETLPMSLEYPDAVREVPSVEVLFERHFDDVHRMVTRLLGPGASSADAEDVTQQVFLTAHRAIGRFRGESQPKTWLFGIATRVVLTNLRSWRRQRRLQRAVELEAPPSPSSPEKTAADRQELLRVWRALMKVKAKKRVVYVLHELEGLSGKEIAERLEIPINTVWTRLHHARAELARALERSQA